MRSGVGGIAEALQSVEAASNEMILLSLAVLFLISLGDERVKRRTALRMLHRLRSVAHVIDMHQLTKDPDQLLVLYKQPLAQDLAEDHHPRDRGQAAVTVMALFAVLTLGFAIGPVLWLACTQMTGSRHRSPQAPRLRRCRRPPSARRALKVTFQLARPVNTRRPGRGSDGGGIPAGGLARSPIAGALARGAPPRLALRHVAGVRSGLADAAAGRIAPAGAVDCSFPLEPEGDTRCSREATVWRSICSTIGTRPTSTQSTSQS